MRIHKLPLYFSTRPGPAVEGMNNKSGMVLVYSVSVTMGGLFNTASLFRELVSGRPQSARSNHINQGSLRDHGVKFRGNNIYWTVASAAQLVPGEAV
jgi:hypothetical protein